MEVPSLLQYDANFPIYGISFSNAPSHPHRVALTSSNTGPSNKLTILDLHPSLPPLTSGGTSSADPSSSSSRSASGSRNATHNQYASNAAADFLQQASHNLAFPATKVGWEPERSASIAGGEDDGGRGELLVTTGDVLRIWEAGVEWGQGHGNSGGSDGRGGYVGANRNGYAGNGKGYTLSTRSVLTNSKSPSMSLPPITSFSWNPASPNNIVTCSIDTTATLWDITTSQALTQLIAHDRAVYDLSWLPKSQDIFVSVGADGSLRAFDLRTLEHSTILYESPNETPLARLSFSNREQHMLACFGLGDSRVLILDMRSPGQPVAELVGHQGPLNAIQWGSGSDMMGETGGGWLASCGDDAQLLLYDLTSPLPTDSRPPSTRPSTKPRNRQTQASNQPLNRTPKESKASLSPTAALSPPTSPMTARTPSPSLAAVEIMPARAWTSPTTNTGPGGMGEGPMNNLAFTKDGDWLGCVSGGRLSVLKV